MANNRMYLRCGCGKKFFLTKNMGEAWYVNEEDGDRLIHELNAWFEEHAWCCFADFYGNVSIGTAYEGMPNDLYLFEYRMSQVHNAHTNVEHLCKKFDAFVNECWVLFTKLVIYAGSGERPDYDTMQDIMKWRDAVGATRAEVVGCLNKAKKIVEEQEEIVKERVKNQIDVKEGGKKRTKAKKSTRKGKDKKK